MTYQPRWRYQYQRIADVLQQLEVQAKERIWPRPDWYGHDGQHETGCVHCHIARLVAAAPPLTADQRSVIVRILGGPMSEAAKEDQRKASRSVRNILSDEAVAL